MPRYASYVERLVGVPPWTREARSSLSTAVAATLRCVPERARVSPAELRDVMMRHQCNLYGVTGRAGGPARPWRPRPTADHAATPEASPHTPLQTAARVPQAALRA